MINEVKMVGGRLYVRKLMASAEKEVHNCGNCKDGCRNHSDNSIVHCNQTSRKHLAGCVSSCHSFYRSTYLAEMLRNGSYLAEMLRNGRLVFATEEQAQKSAPDSDYKDPKEPSDQELLDILNEEINELQQTLEQANNAESIALRSAELAIIRNGEYKNTVMSLEQKLKERDTSILKLKAKVFNYALVATSVEAVAAIEELGIAFNGTTRKKSTTDKIINAADKFRNETGTEPEKLYLGECESRELRAESFTSATVEGATFDGMDIVLVKEENHLSCS